MAPEEAPPATAAQLAVKPAAVQRRGSWKEPLQQLGSFFGVVKEAEPAPPPVEEEVVAPQEKAAAPEGPEDPVDTVSAAIVASAVAAAVSAASDVAESEGAAKVQIAEV